MNEIKYDSIKVPIEVVDCARNTVTKKKRNKNKKIHIQFAAINNGLNSVNKFEPGMLF